MNLLAVDFFPFVCSSPEAEFPKRNAIRKDTGVDHPIF